MSRHVVCLFPESDDSPVGPHSTQLNNITRISPCILGWGLALPFTPTETLRAWRSSSTSSKQWLTSPPGEQTGKWASESWNWMSPTFAIITVLTFLLSLIWRLSLYKYQGFCRFAATRSWSNCWYKPRTSPSSSSRTSTAQFACRNHAPSSPPQLLRKHSTNRKPQNLKEQTEVGSPSPASWTSLMACGRAVVTREF